MSNPWTSSCVFAGGYILAAIYRAHRFPYRTIRRRLQAVGK